MSALFRHAVLIAAAVGLAAGAAVAQRYPAQSYPTRLIRLVVPYPAGGPTDLLGRVVAQKLSDGLGQPVIVDNRPGASGNLGSDLVAKAPPDGYTLVLGNNATHATNESLFPGMPYATLRDFAPIALVASVTNLLVVNPKVPARSVTELVAFARANPGRLNYASTGNGSAAHLTGEMFKSATGTDIVHVPYRGGPPAVTDLLSGQVSLMFATLPSVLPYVQAGSLRALAVTSLTRFKALSGVPTLAESGLPGFSSEAWFGILAPAGTPRDIVAALNAAIVKAVNAPDAREKLEAQGFQIVTDSPAEFADFIRAEIAKWAKVVRDSGARLD